MAIKVMVLWHLLALTVSLHGAGMGDTALQQLGMLLGIPMDQDYRSMKQTEAPQFVNDVYDCWSSVNQSINCLPGYYGKDVNLLRASLGAETESPAQAVHSYNTARSLNRSLEISFNVSHTTGQTDVVRYAMLRVYRRALSSDQMADLLHTCSNVSDLNLQLYSQTSTKGGIALFSLRAVQSLSEEDLTSGGWIQFLNLTRMYKSLIDSMLTVSAEKMHSTKVLRTRLVLSGGGCSADVSPHDLGFGSVADEHKAQLVGLAENSLQKDFKFSSVLSAHAEDLARSRREATEGSGDEAGTLELSPEPLLKGSTETSPTPPPSSSQAPLFTSATVSPSEITSLSYTRCKLHTHYISFSDIGLGDVFIHPSGYHANYCAGKCNWSQYTNEKTNQHSSIQSHANFINPDLIPPPCCAPRPESLGKLSAVIRGPGWGEVKMQIYDDMIATDCGCY